MNTFPIKADRVVGEIYRLLSKVKKEDFDELLATIKAVPADNIEIEEGKALQENKLKLVSLVAFLHQEVNNQCLPFEDAVRRQMIYLLKLTQDPAALERLAPEKKAA